MHEINPRRSWHFEHQQNKKDKDVNLHNSGNLYKPVQTDSNRNTLTDCHVKNITSAVRTTTTTSFAFTKTTTNKLRNPMVAF
ncbi:hypothetical protein TcasGA2_TC002781 [Tribolium castaneum]|uniref:Uncharacterized protein n=1 Tax=Tribolium castaneum TaxID=7070 RepID=D6WIP9_TRICA|nr:hypothetical protein TcasGA2_TC002781 [Tribolium castaneum]